jgi:hypothetical protein
VAARPAAAADKATVWVFRRLKPKD